MTAVQPAGARGAVTALGAGLGERMHLLLDDAGPGGHLVAATVPISGIDPISLYSAAVEADLETALWLRPSEGTAFVGIGRAWATEPEGVARFRNAEAAWRDLVRDARIDRPGGDGRGTGPVLLGAMGFTGRRPAKDDVWSAFGPSSLVLPELLLTVIPDAADARRVPRWGAAQTSVPSSVAGAGWSSAPATSRQAQTGWWRGPSSLPSPPPRSSRRGIRSSALVGMFSGAVGRGRIDKVVLARRVGLRSPVELDVPNALRRLAASAPESTIYAFRRGGRTFLGATPERLVSTEGRTFRTVAVAGTIRRGADAAEDEQLGRALLASEKDREEHAIVVAAIRDLLAPVADTLEVAPRPGLMTLRFVQHLVTEISGTVTDAHGLLALGERLHPTPAVGGEPRDVALAMIDEHEGFDRGWYASPIGWLGADGDGELCVALRCGIVDRTRATLFAGCGIVADSDPEQEWEESRIKLRAVISALGIPGDER